MDKPKNIISYKIRNFIFNFIEKRGYFVLTPTGRSSLIDFFTRLKPVSIQDDLIRIGGEADGGYLVPNCLEGVEACFSPGVADSAGFEEELFHRHKIKSHLADYSVDKMPIENNKFSFTKKYIDVFQSKENIRLSDWMSQVENIEDNKDFILQMDIESAEWRVLYDTPVEILKKFRVMVIEFHGFSTHLLQPVSFRLVDNLFRKILDNFSLVHIHPNNCLPVGVMQDIRIPEIVEITFLRKDFVNDSNKELTYPHSLDKKNVPEYEDIIMQQIWNLK
tara:strand:- start:1451 stop:2281 length:831 start_codon:yes stop_codon:yes gene_type:complete